MPALRDRVKVVTATSGTGNPNLGAAVPGYRSFAQAFAGDVNVGYLIEDGLDWETGIGYYSVAGNSLIRSTVDASSQGGAKLDMSATATISVCYLSRDSVVDWPFFDVSNPGGGDASTLSGYFPTLLFGQRDATVDTHSGWDKVNGYWYVPQTGVYDIMFKFRLPDGTPSNKSFGIGVDSGNGDSPNFAWFDTGGAYRKGTIYRRITKYNQGDALRAFTYCDNGSGDNGYVNAAMTIFRVR